MLLSEGVGTNTPVTVVLCPFDEAVATNQIQEVLARHKVVVISVLFSGAWLASSVWKCGL